MKTRTFLLCAAIGVGASLSLEAEQVVVAPSQGGMTSGYSVRLESKVIKGQPYSAETVSETIQTLADGNRIVHRTTGRVYRDAEGRVRREEDRPSGTPAISISDPVANLSWTLNAESKTARETAGIYSINPSDFVVTLNERVATIRSLAVEPTPAGARVTGSVEVQGGGQRGGRGAGGGGRGGGGLGSEPIGTTQVAPGLGGGGGRGARAGGAGGNRVEEQLPNRSIENLLCTGVRRTTTIEKGAIGNEQPIKIVSEEWTSIDLQVLVSTDLNDPRSGRSTYKLVNVRRADPDVTLFKVPADYTITRGAGGRGRGGH